MYVVCACVRECVVCVVCGACGACGGCGAFGACSSCGACMYVRMRVCVYKVIPHICNKGTVEKIKNYFVRTSKMFVAQKKMQQSQLYKRLSQKQCFINTK